jgi:hypothetical protein
MCHSAADRSDFGSVKLPIHSPLIRQRLDRTYVYKACFYNVNGMMVQPVIQAECKIFE